MRVKICKHYAAELWMFRLGFSIYNCLVTWLLATF